MLASGSAVRARPAASPAVSRPSRSLAVRVRAEGVCKTCGADLSKAPAGCDGEGRVMGGMAAVPLFGWWPIKAYRPCPSAEAAGVEYVRKGQGTNEVLFGGVSLGERQQASLERMQSLQDKGLDVDVK